MVRFLWSKPPKTFTTGKSNAVHLFKFYFVCASVVSYVTFVLSLFSPWHAEKIKMPRLLLIFSQSNYLIQVVDINSHSE